MPWAHPSCDNQKCPQGIPWRSSGWDYALSLLRAWVQSLVGELRSHKPFGGAIKKRKKWKKMSPDIAGVPAGGHTYPHLRLLDLDWVSNSNASKGQAGHIWKTIRQPGEDHPQVRSSHVHLSLIGARTSRTNFSREARNVICSSLCFYVS